MTSKDIAHQRLFHQQMVDSHFTDPSALVGWMGCIQAQDFAGAKWGIGNRIKGITDAAIEKDFNDGKILRTHILRPTWHFVTPADIGWMLQLTAPKIKAFNKRLHAKLEITDNDLKRSKKIITTALTNNKQLTRTALLVLLKKAKINTDDIRISFLIMDAELDGLICSGPRQGKQFTYALLEERAPVIKLIDTDAAIAELSKRYFLSRGPATLQDLAWWSGLSISDAKKGIELNKKQLAHMVVNGQAYWLAADTKFSSKQTPTTYLLPSYDEYAVAYKDRNDILRPEYIEETGYGIFKPTIVIDGQIAGTWKRTEQTQKVIIETKLFNNTNKTTAAAITKATTAYADFLGKSL
ncbi:winged helix DNA-binding protein [Chitinophaga niastensis]|uniref:Winged helix DNA-binding protein n=1 Tax=Chitinophaga niastensis TaxID=536980 RepID=A0A2P8HP34_CHINA|nr:winged helix DNA-binding domain-containing protein [Chitinophaga niastensis]PSL47982.1 winged helix DNA-binding protein [Chitinophaga niastensis]